ncbi:MAG: DUF3460 family protein [Burkholderiaceae bacterium]|jgi:hypothetical protein|nr:DUF3460 family protein [Burkholderiaceae bacterium]
MSLARLFYRPHYTSDATQFLAQLQQDHPQWQEAQRQGRARLWERNLDRDLLGGFDAARVAQRPYVYMTGADDYDD